MYKFFSKMNFYPNNTLIYTISYILIYEDIIPFISIGLKYTLISLNHLNTMVTCYI